MDKTDASSKKVFKLRLSLDISDRHMETLRKYGKVDQGITRDILVSGKHSLHQLHYMIQKLFGWQNSHLHCFRFYGDDMEKLVQNSFKRYCRLCGIYFRFIYNDTTDMDDIYWDDDYKDGESFKSWLKRKYKGFNPYRGTLEHYIVAQEAVKRNIDEDAMLRVSPSFAEWREGKQDPHMVKFEDATYEEMFHNYECSLGEVIERAYIGDILALHADDFADTAAVTELLEQQNQNFKSYWTEYCDLLELKTELQYKQNEIKKYSKRKNADPVKLLLLTGEFNRTCKKFTRAYQGIFMNSDKPALPVTNKLRYEYDYGDDWQVKIEVVDEYIMDEDNNDLPELMWQIY